MLSGAESLFRWLRGVLRRADRARQAFYRRVKAGETPGYPRFKSGRRWHTVELANVTLSMVKDRGNYYAIRIKGLPEIRLRKGLTLPEDTPKALSITLRGRRLFVNLTYEVEQAVLPKSDTAVGVDMGVSDRLALSTGEVVKRRRKPSKRLMRVQQRLSRCKKAAIAGGSAAQFLPISSTESASGTATSAIGSRPNSCAASD